MRTLGRVSLAAFVCLSCFAVAQQSDQSAAESVLGPHWKQLSRRAGIIFSGTVLGSSTPGEPTALSSANRVIEGPASVVTSHFRVDEAIAGVESGQILSVHEWIGAAPTNRPLRAGDHILLFLYPPSRLGLTSPVGGSLGQIDLDVSGKNVSRHRPKFTSEIAPTAHAVSMVNLRDVSVIQLGRAIRSARLN